jgi:hypothetical protein
MSRRDALTWLALTPAWAVAASAMRAVEIRIGTAGTLVEDARRGIEFGMREAALTARLVGASVHTAAQLASATGVIAGNDPTGVGFRAGVPVLYVARVKGPLARCSFSVAITDAAAQEAAGRWQSSHPETGSGIAVVEWHASLSRYGASELNERFSVAYGQPMTAAAWRGWFAVKALVDSTLRGEPGDACDALGRSRLDGHKGRPLSFGADGILVQPLYIAQDDRVIGEIG